MPTIYWKPLELTTVHTGDDPVNLVSRLASNERWLQNFFTPQLFSTAIVSQTGASSSAQIGASSNTGSGSPLTLARFQVRGNAARHPVRVTMLALVNNSGTTGTLTVSHAGGSGTVNVTATSATAHAVTVTPTTGSAPLELTISGHTDDSNHVVLVACSARIAPADRTDGGAGLDGFAPLWGDLGNHPISTEWVSRGYNNQRALARDRVACLATLAHPDYSGTTRLAQWTNNSTNTTALGRMRVLPCDNVNRAGVISLYAFVASSVTAKIQIVIGGGQQYSLNVTASGWHHQDIDLPAEGASVTIYGQCDSGSAGDFALITAQVFRKA